MKSTPNFEAYYGRCYAEQMQSWLDYAIDNREGHRTSQTSAGVFTNKQANPAVAPFIKTKAKARQRTNNYVYDRNKYLVNTWTLYKAWKNTQDFSIRNRCYLPYGEAINEMHIFFDYMNDTKEYYENLSTPVNEEFNQVLKDVLFNVETDTQKFEE
tara:strand:+ start:2744 stop:3211 length:468 start_codon:yes stop_codon:yes gene_type:complete